MGLRQHDVVVTTTSDAGLLGEEDAEHLAYALRESRVVVTHDHDFLIAHSADVAHAGIVYCHQDKHGVGDLLRLLLFLHACYQAEEVQGTVEYL